MSTRCNIVIEYGETKIWLYRHHDGYLAATGRDLLDKVTALIKTSGDGRRFAHDGATRLVTALLNSRTPEYEPLPQLGNKPQYEVTIGAHGDIEYLYRIIFLDDNTHHPVMVSFREIDFGDKNRFSIPNSGSLGDFEEDVVAAERAQAARIAAYEARKEGL